MPGSNAIVYLFIITAIQCADGFGCIGKNGVNVSWFVLVKFPAGTAAAYTDNTKLDEGCNNATSTACWSAADVNDPSGPLALSLGQLQQNAPVGYVMVNDEPCCGEAATSSGGHVKGTLALTRSSGFMLSHSTPKFPGRPNANATWMQVPAAQQLKGQHFLCLSLGASAEINQVAELMTLSQVKVYGGALPDSLAESFPQVEQLLSGRGPFPPAVSGLLSLALALHIKLPVSIPPPKEAMLVTPDGRRWRAIAKSPYDIRHLHEQVLEPALKADMAWQTWQVGAGTHLPSSCPTASLQADRSEFSSLNVAMLKAPVPAARHVTIWGKNRDHSKWGVSYSSRDPAGAFWTCFADLNRDGSQARRGGGAICTQGPGLWEAMRRFIVAVQPCSTTATKVT